MNKRLKKKINKQNENEKIVLREQLKELKEEYKDMYDQKSVNQADGDLGKLCTLRDTFDETFDLFFDDESLRNKYDKDFDLSNDQLEKLLNTNELKKLIYFYKKYIDELKEENKNYE